MTVLKTLITGMAGFIGFHLARRLAARGDDIVGIDNLNDYYDVSLKHARLRELGLAVGNGADSKRPQVSGERATSLSAPLQSARHQNVVFRHMDVADSSALRGLMETERFDLVFHLAAQAGVRYSIDAPFEYIDANMGGFLSVLEACRAAPPKHLVYASTSSVYGLNGSMPFSPHTGANHPVSLYAASKKANEAMAHAYSHVFGLATTGLRFFTVYGPWGRPDMAPIKFARAITRGETIDVYNEGRMRRDFTYVEDIVEGLLIAGEIVPTADPSWDAQTADPASSSAPYRVYNIGRGEPVELMDFISALERELGKEAQKNYLPMQPGDMVATWADTSDLRSHGYTPKVSINEGVRRFVEWFRQWDGA
jgi:UDP-glucuronate 4-epimerase